MALQDVKYLFLSFNRNKATVLTIGIGVLDISSDKFFQIAVLPAALSIAMISSGERP